MLRVLETDTRRAGPKSWLADELNATLALSWPLVVANLATNAMTITDIMMLGRLSPNALAAGALGYNLYFPLLIFGVGLISATSPIVARMAGADQSDREGPRRAAHQAFFSVGLLSLPIWIVLWNAGPILRFIGESPGIAGDAATYMHGLQWAIAPNLMFFALRSVFAALRRPGPTLFAGLSAVLVNALGNWILIFGHFGFPALGVFGSGLATFISQTFSMAVLIGYALIDPALSRYRFFGAPWRFDWRAFAELWRLGASIGATVVFETSIFAASTLLMGLISAASLEAHALVFQITSFAFMVPLGVAQAATVRVGHAYGALDPVAASRAGWTAFGVVMAFMVVSAAIMVFGARFLIAGFIDVDAPANLEIVALAQLFLGVAALFQLFDGAQVVGAGMLRGLHEARAPMLIALAGYWGVGLPTGAALAFLTPLKGLGLWIGLAAGLAVVSVLLLTRWRLRERAGFFREAA
jgi:multidrug resistance protein, MATE family